MLITPNTSLNNWNSQEAMRQLDENLKPRNGHGHLGQTAAKKIILMI